MQAYWDAVEQLGMQLIALLAEALGLDAEAFLNSFDKPMLHLRPLHYAAVRSAPDQVSNMCNNLERPQQSCAGTGHASPGKVPTVQVQWGAALQSCCTLSNCAVHFLHSSLKPQGDCSADG